MRYNRAGESNLGVHLYKRLMNLVTTKKYFVQAFMSTFMLAT